MSGDELDVDAELLAMAGDDSSDDEGSDAGEVVDQSRASEPQSPPEEAKPSVEQVEEPAPSHRKGVAQRVKKRGGKKKVTRRELEDELDDLADSPSPDGSVMSDAMDESAPGSPEREASPILDEPLFPLEGRFLSVTDREEIMRMPEIEREAILAERQEQVTKRNQDLQLRQAIQASKDAASKNKRKAAAADLDDGARKSSRPKTEKTGRSALDNYKKAREAKGAERTNRFDKKTDRKRTSRSRSSASDRDADGESEVEWPDESSVRRDEPPADLKDFERCRVGRSNFAKYMFYPGFEDTIPGCYCRVSIGMNRENGQNVYRMAQIKKFAEGKPYMLDAGPNAKSFMCDMYVVAAHGEATKPWPMAACSDGKFTLEEYQTYMNALQKDKLRAPKKGHLVQKLDDINRFLEPTWNEETLAAKFAKVKAMAQRVDPVNIAKNKKQAIIDRRQRAEEADDGEEISRCDAELAALENNAVNGNSIHHTIKHSPAKPVSTSQQDRLAALNQKIRGKNSESVRKALIEERRQLHLQRERLAKAKQEEEKTKKQQQLEVPGKEDLRDLFGDISDVSRAGTPMSGVSTPKLRRSRQGTPMNGVEGKKSKLGVQQAVDDELEGLDLGIDVEI